MTRAREWGIPLDGQTGPWNAITDVTGVLVGHTTLTAGQGPLIVGVGPVRTGVTAILPRGRTYDPVFAAHHVLNGNGEMTGAAYVEESGLLESPILLTNTHSVGVVRDAVIDWTIKQRFFDPAAVGARWSLPVVAETFDGWLNDVNGFHVRREHVHAALDSACSRSVAEGNVGGGTGMRCHGFKGGIGTASRVTDGGYTVGVLVQANHGSRMNLTIAGVPVGRHLDDLSAVIHSTEPAEGSGSIIVVLATDAPLLPHQLKRLARRVPMGIARLGDVSHHGSGDIFVAFSTANSGAASLEGPVRLTMLPNGHMTPLFQATVEATEEAILNAMVAAETMTGINGNTVYALPRERVLCLLRRYHRLNE